MKKYFFIFTVFLLVVVSVVAVCVLFPANTHREPLPAVYVKEEIWDFGNLPSRNTYEHCFTVVNNSAKPLKLTRGKSSCGCTVPEIPEEAIPAGGEGEIHVTLYAETRSGNFFGKVAVNTDNPGFPVLMMGMRGKLLLYEGFIGVDPDKISFDDIPLHTSVQEHILIKRPGEDLLNLLSVTCDIPGVILKRPERWSVLEQNTAQYAEYTLTVPADFPPGPFSGNVVVTTEHDTYPRVSIPVTGNIVPHMSVFPDEMVVILDENNQGSCRTYIENIQKEPFKVLEIKSTGGQQVKTGYTELKPYRWEIAYSTALADNEEIREDVLEITTDYTSESRITIPVKIIKL